VELLVQALNRYEGSMVIVSHDRYFISRTANVFWEIIDHQIREFRGTYEEYVLWKEKLEAQRAANMLPDKPAPKEAEKPQALPAGDGKGKPLNKELQKTVQKQQRLFEKLEQELNALQGRKTELEAALASPEVYASKERFLEMEKQYANAQQEITRVQSAYEEAFAKLMELEEQLQAS
jgi:ATP-binding cassette subfamily F protein 3